MEVRHIRNAFGSAWYHEAACAYRNAQCALAMLDIPTEERHKHARGKIGGAP